MSKILSESMHSPEHPSQKLETSGITKTFLAGRPRWTSENLESYPLLQVQGVPIKQLNISSSTPAIVVISNFIDADDYIIQQVGWSREPPLLVHASQSKSICIILMKLPTVAWPYTSMYKGEACHGAEERTLSFSHEVYTSGTDSPTINYQSQAGNGQKKWTMI